MDYDRNIYEGWTPRAFIERLLPQFDYVMQAWNPPMKTRDDVKRWTASSQPYYKKPVPEVVSFFTNRMKEQHGDRIKWLKKAG